MQTKQNKIKTGQKNHPFYFLLFILFLLLSSCKTSPETSDIFIEEKGYIPLEPGAFAYILANVQKAKPVLDNMKLINMNNKQMQQIINMTQSAAVSVYLYEDKGQNLPQNTQQNLRKFQVCAWGSYPAKRAKMALGLNKNWKKQRSKINGADYWYSTKDKLSFAMDHNRAFVSAVMTDTPIDPYPVAPGTKIPEGFEEFHTGSILSCWLNNPGPVINQKINEIGIPIDFPAEQIFVSLLPVKDEQYEARLKMKLPSATQARALATILNLARNFFSPGEGTNSASVFAAILFANRPVLDDDSIIIKSNALSGTEISLLFNMFSL